MKLSAGFCSHCLGSQSLFAVFKSYVHLVNQIQLNLEFEQHGKPETLFLILLTRLHPPTADTGKGLCALDMAKRID